MLVCLEVHSGLPLKFFLLLLLHFGKELLHFMRVLASSDVDIAHSCFQLLESELIFEADRLKICPCQILIV